MLTNYPKYEMDLGNNDDAFRDRAKTAYHGAMSSFHSLVTFGFYLVRNTYKSNVFGAFSRDLND